MITHNGQPILIAEEEITMKKAIGAMLLLAASYQSYAQGGYTIDEAVSTVNFATIKKQYVVEPASVSQVSGQVSESGELSASVPLNKISTGVSIRDDRLNQLFFNSAAFPTIDVQSNIPADLLKADSVVKQITLPVALTIMGNTQTVDMNLNVVKSGDIVAVSSARPVIISASAFGIPAENLTQLAATVGGIAISDTVPVNISLVLKK